MVIPMLTKKWKSLCHKSKKVNYIKIPIVLLSAKDVGVAALEKGKESFLRGKRNKRNITELGKLD
jgi:hypothetical protein